MVRIAGSSNRRRGVCDDAQASLLDSLANASVQGLVATGPRRGCRVLRLGIEPGDGEATIRSKRCAEVAGFNLHANVRVAANDREGLEHLCKYLARPPIASERLAQLPDGRLALRFKQAWRYSVRKLSSAMAELAAAHTVATSAKTNGKTR